MSWIWIVAFWSLSFGVVWAFFRACKVQDATPTEQRVRLAHDWQASIRRDVRRDGMRRASQLRMVRK